MILFLFRFFVCFLLNTYRSIGLYLSFKIFMRISLFNFICHYTLNHSEWTNENTLELCPFFLILMRKCFVLFCFVCFFISYCLPKTYHKPLPIYIGLHSPPKKKEKERKHQKERHKQRNITITRQSSLIQ